MPVFILVLNSEMIGSVWYARKVSANAQDLIDDPGYNSHTNLPYNKRNDDYVLPDKVTANAVDTGAKAAASIVGIGRNNYRIQNFINRIKFRI